jgi:hypothetical protein
MVEGAEIIDPDEWSKAELERQLVAMARNGESNSIQFERLQEQLIALIDVMESEPRRLGS